MKLRENGDEMNGGGEREKSKGGSNYLTIISQKFQILSQHLIHL